MKNGRIWHLFLFSIISTLLISACSSSRISRDAPEGERFRNAVEEYQKNHFYEAREQLQTFTLMFPGSTKIDSALYLLGQANYKMGDYLIAANEFSQIIKNFPASVLADDAQYQMAMSFYELSPGYGLDQEHSIEARDNFQALIEDYPDSPFVDDSQIKQFSLRTKLARKTYESGKLYKRSGYYNASITYYNKVIEFYYDTEWGPRAFFEIGECFEKLSDWNEAFDTFQEFIQRYPDHLKVDEAKFKVEELAKKILNRES